MVLMRSVPAVRSKCSREPERGLTSRFRKKSLASLARSRPRGTTDIDLFHSRQADQPMRTAPRAKRIAMDHKSLGPGAALSRSHAILRIPNTNSKIDPVMHNKHGTRMIQGNFTVEG